MWINHVSARYQKPKKQFSPIPMLVIIRVFAGFLFAVMTAFINYEGNILSQAITLLPYTMFAISMILFFKRRIEFRLWYVNGAILNIGALYYMNGLPIGTIILDAILVLLIFVSPYIKEHYKKKGYVEVDISDV